MVKLTRPNLNFLELFKLIEYMGLDKDWNKLIPRVFLSYKGKTTIKQLKAKDNLNYLYNLYILVNYDSYSEY